MRVVWKTPGSLDSRIPFERLDILGGIPALGQEILMQAH